MTCDKPHLSYGMVVAALVWLVGAVVIVWSPDWYSRAAMLALNTLITIAFVMKDES